MRKDCSLRKKIAGFWRARTGFDAAPDAVQGKGKGVTMEHAHRGSHVAAFSRRGDPIGHVRMSVSERRLYRRGRIAADATIKIHDETFSAELLDISAGGARLRCSVVPRAGTEIGVEVQGIGSFQAKVIRRLPNCVAVEFHFSENQRSLVAEKLDSLTMEPAWEPA